MKRLPPNLEVTYKYDIRMTHITSTYKQLILKWSNTYLGKIYNGRYLLLVSPIFRLGDQLFVLPTLDVDLPFLKAFDYLHKFFSKSKKRKMYWFAEYTGKNGFHIYAKFLVRLTENIDDIKFIRGAILNPFGSELSEVDQISSIRNIPMVRIGYRTDVGRMAIPVTNMDPQWIIKMSRQRGFKGIFDLKSLQKYIREYIIPPRYIEYSQYPFYIR